MQAYHWLTIDDSGVGRVFGDWRQEGPEFLIKSRRHAVVECVRCGRRKIARADHLTGDRTTCRKCSPSGHGMSHTSEHCIWSRMIDRCHNENHSHFHDYGGRGIKVCDEWRGPEGFMRFYEHVGARPSPAHQLDREENDGDYEPGNVRWATRVVNCRNKRNNVLLTIDGETMCATEWSERPGTATKYMICARKSRGWSDRDAVFGKGIK